jgi:hypothetical protein
MMKTGNSAKARERRLIRLFARLDAQAQETLMAFAEFLASRESVQAPRELPEPQPIARPPRESVVAAIKRLSASYPMLDKARMLNETSNLMTQHVMQGRDVAEVIDELEEVFRRHYRELRQEFDER